MFLYAINTVEALAAFGFVFVASEVPEKTNGTSCTETTTQQTDIVTITTIFFCQARRRRRGKNTMAMLSLGRKVPIRIKS